MCLSLLFTDINTILLENWAEITHEKNTLIQM